MAEGAVTFLLEQLAILIREERQLLGRLHEKVKDIERQLRLMQAFLRVADAKEDNDPELKEWVRQVRELAYDAEDVLDMFMLRFGHQSTDGFLGCFKKVYATMKNYSARRNVAFQLREIESRVNKMKEDHLRFQTKYEAYMNSSSSHIVSHKFDGRDDARLVDAKVLVGSERPKEELINQILDGVSQLKAISVVGMGGLGKSTLVNSIYEDEQVKTQFQCHAWVTISQVYDTKELFKNLIRDFYVEIKEPFPENVKSLDDVIQLKKFVQNFLRQKSYIIVLDDIWNINAWDDIRHALPNSNTGSRVLLTTRILDVANATRVEYYGHVCEMNPLSFENSWALFCSKTFQDKICPQHLEGIAKCILAKCDGLPLAILAIGGLLALKEKDARSDWEMILNSFNSELDRNLERVKHVILLSYYDLPYYLKSCLLYFSILPEDWTISRHLIIRLWSAEGLVQESENRRTEVGAGYLDELIRRNLVEVMTKTFGDETDIGYSTHDIVREVIVSKSREQNFMNMQGQIDPTLPTKVRRLAFHSSMDNPLESSSFKNLRSIVFMGEKDSVSRQFINDMLAENHKLLKVLNLESAPLQEIPNAVFKLHLLTYLCLSRTEVKVIPKSIGKLLCLETLDVSNTDVIELPIQMLKLKRLCHLFVYKDFARKDHLLDTLGTQSLKAPYRIGCLSSLQSLQYIDADKMGDTSIVEEIGKLTQLRDLGICKLRREDGKDLCSSLGKLSHLRYLTVISIEANEKIDLDYSLSSIPQLLQELRLEGRLEKVPRWIPFLLELEYLDLESSKLRDDPLELLEDLPNLEHLQLTDAYEGTTLHFKAGKFQRLKRIDIMHMRGLKSITLEEDSMPRLIELDIRYCKLMMELPVGLEHLTKLQVFKVKCMNEQFVAALENGKRSDKKLAHIPMAVYDYDGNEWKYF